MEVTESSQVPDNNRDASKFIQKTGRVVQVALPVGVALYTLCNKDFEGLFNWLEILTANQLAIWILKKGFTKLSGQTAAAAACPCFLAIRYGTSNMQGPIVLTTLAAIGVGFARWVPKNLSIQDIVKGGMLGAVAASVLSIKHN